MKAYKIELSHFFSVKKGEELRLQKTLKKKSFEEKKKIIEEYRASAVLKKGTFTIEDHEFKREHFIRDIHYLEQLKRELEEKYLQFNKYKYDVLYELAEMNESEYDRLSAEIEEIKQKRDEVIHKKAAKQEPIHEHNEKHKNAIIKLMDKFNNPDTVLEDKKDYYRDIMKHKIAIFNIIKPHLTMVSKDKTNTLVIDYLPIRGNQRNMMKLNESVSITPISLEDVGEVEISAEEDNSSENKQNASFHSTPSYEYAYENGSLANGSLVNGSLANGSLVIGSLTSGSNQNSRGANGSLASGSNQNSKGANGSNQNSRGANGSNQNSRGDNGSNQNSRSANGSNQNSRGDNGSNQKTSNSSKNE
jgi:hypothetical protein